MHSVFTRTISYQRFCLKKVVFVFVYYEFAFCPDLCLPGMLHSAYDLNTKSTTDNHRILLDKLPFSSLPFLSFTFSCFQMLSLPIERYSAGSAVLARLNQIQT